MSNAKTRPVSTIKAMQTSAPFPCAPLSFGTDYTTKSPHGPSLFLLLLFFFYPPPFSELISISIRASRTFSLLFAIRHLIPLPIPHVRPIILLQDPPQLAALTALPDL